MVDARVGVPGVATFEGFVSTIFGGTSQWRTSIVGWRTCKSKKRSVYGDGTGDGGGGGGGGVIRDTEELQEFDPAYSFVVFIIRAFAYNSIDKEGMEKRTSMFAHQHCLLVDPMSRRGMGPDTHQLRAYLTASITISRHECNSYVHAHQRYDCNNT